jgi:hypothetical protein
MPENLLIAVMGHQNSGKSTTWNDLFGDTVKTGKWCRMLWLNDNESVEVFLISGSPQERQLDVEAILDGKRPRIVLYSLQYVDGVWATYDFFFRNDYSAFVQWLNPGYSDGAAYPDDLELIPRLLGQTTLLSMRDGTAPTETRVQELRECIAGWARPRGLIQEAVVAAIV